MTPRKATGCLAALRESTEPHGPNGDGSSPGQRGPADADGPKLYVPPPSEVRADSQEHSGKSTVPQGKPQVPIMHLRQNHHETLFHRFPKNPILSAVDWPYPINTVFNAGATVLGDGQTLLLCRVEDRRGHSHLCAARSADGVSDWTIDPQPTLRADPENHPEELWGIEDPRITFMSEIGRYAIAYTGFGKGGPGVSQ